MKMKIDLSTSTDNLLYMDYMNRKQLAADTESNEDLESFWYCDDRPQDDLEEEY